MSPNTKCRVVVQVSTYGRVSSICDRHIEVVHCAVFEDVGDVAVSTLLERREGADGLAGLDVVALVLVGEHT